MEDETNQTPAQPETQAQTDIPSQSAAQAQPETAAQPETIEQQITDVTKAEAGVESRVTALENEQNSKLVYPPEVEARFAALEAAVKKHADLFEKHGIRDLAE